jgi:hypothetical protein
MKTLTERQIELINDIVEYIIDDERDHLEEEICSMDYTDEELEGLSDLTDEQLFKFCKTNDITEHIWLNLFELKQSIQ